MKIGLDQWNINVGVRRQAGPKNGHAPCQSADSFRQPPFRALMTAVVQTAKAEPFETSLAWGCLSFIGVQKRQPWGSVKDRRGRATKS